VNKQWPDQILRTQDYLADKAADVFRAPVAAGTLENFEWHAGSVLFRRDIVKTTAHTLKSLSSLEGRGHSFLVNEPFPKEKIESLWAPWRVEYFQAEHSSRVDFLSEAAATSDDAAHLVVARRPTAFLLMNKYPYSAGHLMAVPCRKVCKMSEVTEDEILDLWRLSIHAQRLLEIAVKAQGFNVGWNLGKASGAGVEDHLHIHIVPRWVGDSNFIAVIGGTRIIPQGLMPLYHQLVNIDKELQHS
jgi:ATP adenylyltransferase